MKRPSAPMVVSLIALVFSMSGGALAAHQYLLTSINQIRPGVLAQIRSKAAVGAPGAAGAASTVAGPAGASVAGPRGEAGASSTVPGPAGLAGTPGEVGPRGESVVGPRGEAGASSVFVVEERVAELRELYVGEQLSTAATCPEGSTPVGGSFQSEPEGVGVVIGSYPNTAGGWATSIEVTHLPPTTHTGLPEATFLVWADCTR
jgi:hypothetical protein